MNGMIVILFMAAFMTQTGVLASGFSESPPGARAYIISPKDGQVLDRTFTVRFGLENMGVAPAGVNVPDTGHHHLLVNLKELPGMKKPLPSNENVRHFGKGETETKVALPPGKHTLQLLLGNYLHIPHRPPVLSEKITVIVKDR